MLWFNIYLKKKKKKCFGLKFSNQFDFDFPLLYFVIHHLKQREIKSNWFKKKLTPKMLNYNIYIYIWVLSVSHYTCHVYLNK